MLSARLYGDHGNAKQLETSEEGFFIAAIRDCGQCGQQQIQTNDQQGGAGGFGAPITSASTFVEDLSNSIRP